MTGGRHAADNPIPGVLKTAGFLLRLLAGLVVLLSLAALLGGLIYIMVSGTDAEAWAVSGLAGLIILGGALTDRGRDQAVPAWAGASMVLNVTGLLLGSLAGQHDRPAAQAHTMSLVSTGLRAAGITCACIALLYILRSGALPWLRQRRAASRNE
jgi:hypothetical protein